MKYFHYTPEVYLEQIIKTGVIKLATESVSSQFEKAVAWVSTNPHFEQTALKAIIDKKDGKRISITFEQQVKMFGCARFEIKPTFKLHNWTDITKLANIRTDTIKALEDVGIERGANPNEWYGSLKPIPREQWLRLEQYVNGKWVEVYNFETQTQSVVEGVGEDCKTKRITYQKNQ